jgi:hypothetical protein
VAESNATAAVHAQAKGRRHGIASAFGGLGCASPIQPMAKRLSSAYSRTTKLSRRGDTTSLVRLCSLVVRGSFGCWIRRQHLVVTSSVAIAIRHLVINRCISVQVVRKDLQCLLLVLLSYKYRTRIPTCTTDQVPLPQPRNLGEPDPSLDSHSSCCHLPLPSHT